jgi:pyruvate dehydrogenase E2 component (dihydrolipoamide acetyltransferase)
LCRRACTNIKPADSRYDRGTNGGQVIGHIGGTGFTPIVNSPDVAILGSTAIQLRPAPADDGSIAWRKMLPLSLSYDHRVINGADAARFVRAIGEALADPALVVLRQPRIG